MSFADRVKKSKLDRQGFVFPVGELSTRYVDHKFGKSKNGEDMFTLNFKVLAVKSLDDKNLDVDEIMETIKEKGKKVEVKLLTRLSFQFDKVLEFLSDAGMDLSECNEKDRAYKDVRKLLEELEELRPKATIVVRENSKDVRRRNYYINDVEVVGDCQPESDDEKPKSSKKPPVEDNDDDKPTPKKKSKIKPTTEDGETYDDLIENGWTHKQIAKHHPELIDEDDIPF